MPQPFLVPVSPPPPAQSATIRQVAAGLEHPISITHAGDGRLFITQQDGQARILDNGALLEEPFLDLRGQTGHALGDEDGLLSLAFHPRFAQNGLVFATSSNLDGSVVLARYHVSAADPNRADPASRKVLLTIPKPYDTHHGGQLQFGPDGYLYVGLGDGGGGGDPQCLAQQNTSLLGKILRLDIDTQAGKLPYYSIPANNPFRGRHPMPDEVWAYGLRNPWRFSFDRRTGDLWIGDVGQNLREEVNFQPAGSAGGQNYGWKVMQGSTCHNRTGCPATGIPVCRSLKLTLPVLEFEQEHGSECAMIAGYVYRGRQLPHLYGLYLFGDLCTGRIWTARRNGSTWEVREVVGQVPLLTTFGEDRDGEIFLASLDGSISRLAAEHPIDTPALYDTAAGRFLLEDLFTGGDPDLIVRFGPRGTGWLPVAGDWDGDGRTGIGLWDPETGIFRLRNKLDRGPAEAIVTLAPSSSETLPLAGDWDGDGRDTVGLYDPEPSTFNLGTMTFVFGDPREDLLPVAGDWDGDGRDTVGLYDRKTGTFLLRNTLGAGPADLEIRFGPAGKSWLPLAGDWNGDGRDGIGLYDPATSTFRLRNPLSGGPADVTVRFGTPRAGWLPVVGEW